MQRPFDQNADDFTLEKIIEFGFDQYAEAINEISGAATKELAIEQVWTKFVHGIIYILTIRLSDHLKWHYYDKRWEFTLRQNVQHHLGQSEDWIFCVWLVMHIYAMFNVTRFSAFVGITDVISSILSIRKLYIQPFDSVSWILTIKFLTFKDWECQTVKMHLSLKNWKSVIIHEMYGSVGWMMWKIFFSEKNLWLYKQITC